MIFYEKIYDDSHLGSFTESESLASQFGWLENTLNDEDVEKSELNGWTYLKGYAPQKPESQKTQEQIQKITDAVQKVLDDTAHSKGYDSGAICATYVFDDDETFKSEGIAYVKWRGKVWRYCYDLLDKFNSGEIEMPSIEYVIENMPKIEWKF